MGCSVARAPEQANSGLPGALRRLRIFILGADSNLHLPDSSLQPAYSPFSDQAIPCSQGISFIKGDIMFTVQRSIALLGFVFFFGGATLVSAADDSQDYRAASKAYFQLAVAHSRLNETQAACIALSQSLESYRAALATENLSTGYVDETTSEGSDEGKGMQELRAKFGCVSTLAASSR